MQLVQLAYPFLVIYGPYNRDPFLVLGWITGNTIDKISDKVEIRFISSLYQNFAITHIGGHLTVDVG